MSGFVIDSTRMVMGIHPGAYGNAHSLNVAREIHSGIPEIPHRFIYKDRSISCETEVFWPTLRPKMVKTFP